MRVFLSVLLFALILFGGGCLGIVSLTWSGAEGHLSRGLAAFLPFTAVLGSAFAWGSLEGVLQWIVPRSLRERRGCGYRVRALSVGALSTLLCASGGAILAWSGGGSPLIGAASLGAIGLFAGGVCSLALAFDLVRFEDEEGGE